MFLQIYVSNIFVKVFLIHFLVAITVAVTSTPTTATASTYGASPVQSTDYVWSRGSMWPPGPITPDGNVPTTGSLDLIAAQAREADLTAHLARKLADRRNERIKVVGRQILLFNRALRNSLNARLNSGRGTLYDHARARLDLKRRDDQVWFYVRKSDRLVTEVFENAQDANEAATYVRYAMMLSRGREEVSEAAVLCLEAATEAKIGTDLIEFQLGSILFQARNMHVELHEERPDDSTALGSIAGAVQASGLNLESRPTDSDTLAEQVREGLRPYHATGPADGFR